MTDFMSKAHAIRNAVNWNSNSSVEVIAEALRANFAAGQQDILRRLREPNIRNMKRVMKALGISYNEIGAKRVRVALTAAADAIEREIRGE